MKGYQCSNCQYETMIAIRFCPKCRQQSFQEMTVPSEGIVYSFTTIRVAPPEYEAYAPYQVALVSLTNNLRVTAFMQEEIAIGDEVVFKEVRDSAFVFEGKVAK